MLAVKHNLFLARTLSEGFKNPIYRHKLWILGRVLLPFTSYMLWLLQELIKILALTELGYKVAVESTWNDCLHGGWTTL